MMKKKYFRRIFSYRYFIRLAILMSPVLLVLVLQYGCHQITGLALLGYFLPVFLLTAVGTAWVFWELEKFTLYLYKLEQENESDLPQLRSGIFGTQRLAHAFAALKNKWARQLNTDSWILQNLPVSVCILNPRKKIVFANQKMFSAFSHWRHQKGLTDAFFTPEIMKSLNTLYRGSERTQSVKWCAPTGKTFQVLMGRLPIATADKGTIVLMFQDISALEEMNHRQSEFVANASHEFKTPLSIIAGFVQTLQTSAKNDEKAREQFLQLIAHQTQKMQDLMQNLLLSAQQNYVQNEQKTIVLAQMLQSLVQNMATKAAQHHQKIVLTLDKNTDNIAGNFAPLFSVYQNILDNALKYGAKNSTIEIKSCLRQGRTKTYFFTSIYNKGNPIPQNEQKRIFERFYRMNWGKETPDGTGLGLSIAQKITADYQGRIRVRSPYKSGTAFDIYIPIKPV